MKLRIEDIKALGWRHKYSDDNKHKFEKGDRWKEGSGLLYFDEDESRLIIARIERGFSPYGFNSSLRFNGIIKTKDEFSMVCRMVEV